jgi:V-type H+-transporting ATPase subunit E
MNQEQVRKQIENMKAFIMKEAQEKRDEILAKADEEFSMEKARLLQAERMKITKDYERKEKQLETNKKIAYSNQLNQARLKVLKAREDIVVHLKERAQDRLAELGKPGQEYETLLQQLILQALIKLDETKVSLRCRKDDESSVKSVLSAAVEAFKQKSHKKDVKVTIDTVNYLPAGPGKSNSLVSCCGGVVLSAHDGKIVCDNTLDQRLALAFDANIPKIRSLVFSS